MWSIQTTFFSTEAGVAWNVIFRLFGIMVIGGVKQTGFFELLATWAVQRSYGRPHRLMILLVIVTALASAFLDNVTTVLLIAPVIFVACRQLALPVVPFLIAEVFASKIGGTAALIGDPPNIVIASRADLSFNDFLIHLAAIVVILLLVFVLMCRISSVAHSHTTRAVPNKPRN